MKYILTLLIVFTSQLVLGQNDSITLDQLQVPSSPALNILDIAPNSIDRPKNPTDFAVALGNATSGFTLIPKNYAIEFAPYWVFGKNKATYQDFIIDNPGKNILQTATFSIGTKDAKSVVDSSEFRKVAIALKFSLWRGRLGSDFKSWSDSVLHYLGRVSRIEGQKFADTIMHDEKNKIFITLLQRQDISAEEKSKWQDSIIERQKYLEIVLNKAKDSLKNYKENVTVLKGLMSRTDFRRYGFKMDYAIGSALDFPDSNFQKSYVSKISTWLTLGWEQEKGLNWLGVIRYNHNINKLYRNTANKLIEDVNIGEMDYGIRLYSDVTTKFTLSFEILARKRIYNKSKLSANNISFPENTSRQVFSANYKVGKNQNLAFTFGKNFDNTQIKEGNLIAALNFLIGFGSARPFAKN